MRSSSINPFFLTLLFKIRITVVFWIYSGIYLYMSLILRINFFRFSTVFIPSISYKGTVFWMIKIYLINKNLSKCLFYTFIILLRVHGTWVKGDNNSRMGSYHVNLNNKSFIDKRWISTVSVNLVFIGLYYRRDLLYCQTKIFHKSSRYHVFIDYIKTFTFYV